MSALMPYDLFATPSHRLPRRGSSQQAIIVALSIGVCLLVVAWILALRERSNEQDAKKWAMRKFGLASSVINKLDQQYQDANRDLVADPPTEEIAWIRPQALKFSYVVSDGAEGEAATWQPLMDSISEATGIPVEFHATTTIEEQLLDLKSGTLHITALNTGSVPRAVNACGFVPVCTLGSKGDKVGYRSLIIVPSNSELKSVADLKSNKITFTSPNSNSGFKAPLALLSQEFDMNPDIDYQYSFAASHDKAIGLIADKEAAAAAVASDLLERAVRNGDIGIDQFRIIYESERFPPAAFGYAYNLDPDIAEKIRTALTDFEMSQGPLAELFAHIPEAAIVPVSYKDDFALIRRIDNSLGVEHTVKPVAAKPAAPETAS